jgi:hypothetical protein
MSRSRSPTDALTVSGGDGVERSCDSELEVEHCKEVRAVLGPVGVDQNLSRAAGDVASGPKTSSASVASGHPRR